MRKLIRKRAHQRSRKSRRKIVIKKDTDTVGTPEYAKDSIKPNMNQNNSNVRPDIAKLDTIKFDKQSNKLNQSNLNNQSMISDAKPNEPSKKGAQNLFFKGKSGASTYSDV